ncbi:MAG TPA: histidine kinase dimerization/phospho-acceptor domain-containing protein, partial [Candidatus Paceibacterota bacterium]
MDHQTLTEVHNTPLTDRKFAHDLRNALSPILLYAQFLEESLAKLSLENETQMARLITESVKEMNTMIVERCGRRDADS